jgi:hypothetical protein
MSLQIRKTWLALGAALGFGIVQAQASTVTLPLGNLHSGSNIDNYFIGGHDSTPNDGDGPNVGFTFSANATAQKAGSSSTSDGRFENEPSTQGEVLFFSSSSTVAAAMNYAAGFTAISFFYSIDANNANNAAIGQVDNTPAYQSATVNIWSGLNGTGTVLDTITLTPVASPTVACQTHGDDFCNWQQAVASGFVGAESVTFGPNSASAFTEFDDVQVTVPLPPTVWLMLSAMLGAVVLARRQMDL